MNKLEFRKEWEYFCSRINWKLSFLDARAITFMNEFLTNLDNLDLSGPDAKGKICANAKARNCPFNDFPDDCDGHDESCNDYEGVDYS